VKAPIKTIINNMQTCLFDSSYARTVLAFIALTLLVGRQKGHPACKKTKWWGAGMVICLERGADLHMAQLMPRPLTVSHFSKIQIGFTFLVLAYPGSARKRAIKRACVCVRMLEHESYCRQQMTQTTVIKH